MKEETIYIIKNNPVIYNYLREESNNYKYLYRDDKYLKEIEKKAKEKYQLRVEDKLERLKDNIELINTFMSVID